ncbi:MAG TPA: aldo/keto reductase [Polyangiales bacterium]|nr:aldo/keto reductase [Polyangiales bacterium]
MSETILLPGTDVRIPRLGVGTWAWGDKRVWGMGGYDASLSEASIREAYEASLRAGVTLLDTAEVYGSGESERIIGRLLAQYHDSSLPAPQIATKFLPAPWKLNVKVALVDALRASLDRLGRPHVDLYQLHGPISLRSHGALAEALALAHQQGLFKAVGVSNYSLREAHSIKRELEARGLKLATNQVEFSLLRRAPELGGLLEGCKQLGVTVLAYSPIGQGRLTGKYSSANPPPGQRHFSAHPMKRVDPIVAALKRIGKKHERTPSQVALNWLIAKGAVPIPGAKNKRQAEDNAGALGWSVDAEDLAALDATALEGKRSLVQSFWQHG